jgi:hypothetical protein
LVLKKAVKGKFTAFFYGRKTKQTVFKLNRYAPEGTTKDETVYPPHPAPLPQGERGFTLNGILSVKELDHG